jgi:hypothetical protein
MMVARPCLYLGEVDRTEPIRGWPLAFPSIGWRGLR